MTDDMVIIDLGNDGQLDRLAAAVAKRLPPHQCVFSAEHRGELRSFATSSIATKKTAWNAAIVLIVAAAIGAVIAGAFSWLKERLGIGA
jgi:hypothetical protein